MAPPDDPTTHSQIVDATTVSAATDADASDTSTTRPTALLQAANHGRSTALRAVPTTAFEIASGPYVSVIKPTFDRLVALVLLVVLSPVLLAGMAAVRLSLGKKVFFVQQRVGLGGKIFSTYKLRTMDHDRRETSEGDIQAFRDGQWDGIERRNTHKSARDPRLNKVGRVMRTFSVDEIPQLFNILLGDMSLVGPRPELPGVVDKHYEAWMHRRHVVKPGLTGLWQISERGNGMMHEHVDVDIDYVDSIGFAPDLRILISTPYAALGPRRGF